jgi:hypothetical protein
MPITFTVDHTRSEIHSIAAGPVTFTDISDHLLEEKRSQTLHYREFVDGREAVAQFTPADSLKIADLLRSLNLGTKVGRKAILAPNPLAYGLTRVIEVVTEAFCEVRPFLDEQEARTWLARE